MFDHQPHYRRKSKIVTFRNSHQYSNRKTFRLKSQELIQQLNTCSSVADVKAVIPENFIRSPRQVDGTHLEGKASAFLFPFKMIYTVSFLLGIILQPDPGLRKQTSDTLHFSKLGRATSFSEHSITVNA